MRASRILIRFPNWLGDLVMSVGFWRKLKEAFPNAKFYAIVKEEIGELLPLFGEFERIFLFSKEKYKGVMGIFRFSREIKGEYDIYFSLPTSFSSALLGFLSGSRERIGYSAEMRDFLLTKVLKKPKNMHRAEEYAYLLRDFHTSPLDGLDVRISVPPSQKILNLRAKYKVGVNINSEAQSRRMSHKKWANIINGILDESDSYVILTGSKKDIENVKHIEPLIKRQERLLNLSGKTNLVELSEVIKSLDLFISSDSGPAHLSNALHVPTIVLFGAGDERNTAPYNRKYVKVIRENIDCSPCLRNECKFGIPKCLEQINEKVVVETALKLLR